MMLHGSVNPFVEYRHHLDVYTRALDRGLSDEAYVELVTNLNEKVEAADGVGFTVTPLVELDLASEGAGAGPVGAGAGPVTAKVETGAVGGSHKARHLFGLVLHYLIEDKASTETSSTRDLAIASCGNAAIGAAIVAKATMRRLQVFVPSNADQAIMDRLDGLGAKITVCPRDPSSIGDPCITALDDAIANGAQAFTVQGPRCPAVIDGCRTLGLELATQLDDASINPASIYIQIGGGALATAVMDGLGRAWPNRRLPRLHPVQARAAHPFVAGWRRVVRSLLGPDDPGEEVSDWELAQFFNPLVADKDRVEVSALLAGRSELMTPWPDPPHSVASGIIDDVTYDWLTLATHQSTTGGWPILVDEPTFSTAAVLAGDQISPPLPRPDETGAAGLAGLIEHHQAHSQDGGVDEPAVVLLTGAAQSGHRPRGSAPQRSGRQRPAEGFRPLP
ncbi:MAG: PLP-dependent lyase/thiolase [Actinomycetia bacterium]|nr:PLP-dependent lyase/thiolase [Actinomycetes bacterium]